MQNKVMKYITRIGQKTGMLKNSKKVQMNAMTVAFVAEYQNLNSEKKGIKLVTYIHLVRAKISKQSAGPTRVY
jgi:hypothetical protein